MILLNSEKYLLTSPFQTFTVLPTLRQICLLRTLTQSTGLANKKDAMISAETIFKSFVASHPQATPEEIAAFVRGCMASLGDLCEGGIEQTAAPEAPAEIASAETATAPVPRRKWVVKGEEVSKCIKNDTITCPICGVARSVITAKHLASHGYTPESFRKACGWDAKVSLMSKKHAKKMRDNVAKAQSARKAKQAAE